jgi:Baseplate J-like protein
VNAPLDVSLDHLDDCGCCLGTRSSVPAVVFNRPGLTALAYRSATWHEFRASLIAALSAPAHRPLAALTTRADDDFSIALLDAVAAMGDVLGFYGERIVQESYLRTATERRSILELARLIGYELRPGVAASTLLAFEVEDPPGQVSPALAPRVATVDAGIKVQSVPGHEEKPQTFETIEPLEARAAWNELRVRPATPNPGLAPSELWLAGTTTGLTPGDPLVLVDPGIGAVPGEDGWNVLRVRDLTPDVASDRTRVTLSAWPGTPTAPGSTAANPSVLALRTRAALFGHSAPDWKAMSPEFKGAYMNDGTEAVASQDEWPGFEDILIPAGSTTSTTSAKVDLDGALPTIIPDSWAIVTTPDLTRLFRVTDAAVLGRAQFALSGKVTRITLSGEDLASFKDAVRTAVVGGQHEGLDLSWSPLAPPATGVVTSLLVEGDVSDLPAGRTLVLAGTDAASDSMAMESAVVDHVTVEGDASRVHLTAPLSRSYLTGDLVVHGNVARATHGETLVSEVLGAGNAGRAFQHFVLKQAPLTHVRSTGAESGTASTLEVAVNGVRWDEVPTFHGRGPAEQVYVTRRDDDGRTVVQFGDGVHGARLPTGQENVIATYRRGIGRAGNVKPGQLSTLLTRPLGIKEATNPIAASGGDDPEPREDARHNAPLTVLTLSRVVSLRDYEDFARAYTGIAKAMATWSWDGEHRGVFITVAGPEATAVDQGVLTLLLDAIREAGDRHVPLRVASYRKATFTTAFNLKTDPDRDRDVVSVAAVDALRGAFGFDARAFGQPVSLSEVIATVAAVPGVIGVDVDALDRTDGIGGSGLVSPLPAAIPAPEALGQTLAAELLTLADAPVTPGVLA